MKQLLKQLVCWFVAVAFVVVLIPLAIVTINGFGPFQKKEAPPDFSASGEVRVYQADTGETVTMPLEEYIVGVVTAEMPASFETEALKAQAVCARTYTISKMNAQKEPDDAHHGADVCTNPAHCQAYTGKEKAYENWGRDADAYYKKITDATLATQGQIMTYDNQVVRAVFHSSNSGRTESAKDVWGGDFPYLTSVESGGEELSPRYQSTVEVSVSDFQNKILKTYPDADFKLPIGNIVRTAGGAVGTIDVGGKTIKGTEMRTLFGLRSSNFTLEEKDGNMVFSVTGNGHGVGMSQYGANYMAAQGKAWKEILKTYYTGVEITSISE